MQRRRWAEPGPLVVFFVLYCFVFSDAKKLSKTQSLGSSYSWLNAKKKRDLLSTKIKTLFIIVFVHRFPGDIENKRLDSSLGKDMERSHNTGKALMEEVYDISSKGQKTLLRMCS